MLIYSDSEQTERLRKSCKALSVGIMLLKLPVSIICIWFIFSTIIQPNMNKLYSTYYSNQMEYLVKPYFSIKWCKKTKPERKETRIFTSCPTSSSFLCTTPHGAMPIVTMLFLDWTIVSPNASPTCFITPVYTAASATNCVHVGVVLAWIYSYSTLQYTSYELALNRPKNFS